MRVTVIMTQGEGLSERQLENLLAPGRERRLARSGQAPPAAAPTRPTGRHFQRPGPERLVDGGSDHVEVDADGAKSGGVVVPRPASADDALDGRSYDVGFDTRAAQHPCGHSIGLVEQGQKEVLRADVAVSKRHRFGLGHQHDLSGPRCETFEHAHTPLFRRRLAECFLCTA